MARGPTLFGHPLHPLLTDLPVGLLAVAPLWDALALFRGEALWWAIGFWTVAAGVAAALPTAATGMMDLLALPKDHPAGDRAARHMTWVLAGVSTYATGLVVRAGPGAPPGVMHWIAPGIDLLALALLSVGGWYGAELVYRDGLGRREPGGVDGRA